MRPDGMADVSTGPSGKGFSSGGTCSGKVLAVRSGWEVSGVSAGEAVVVGVVFAPWVVSAAWRTVVSTGTAKLSLGELVTPAQAPSANATRAMSEIVRFIYLGR